MSDEAGFMDRAKKLWNAGSSTKRAPVAVSEATPVVASPSQIAPAVPGGNKLALRKKYGTYALDAQTRGEGKVLSFEEWVDRQSPGL